MVHMTILLLSLVFVGAAHALSPDEIPIETASDLRDWCRDESEAYFIGRGITPYNWTASWWDEANMLHVEGSWRVGRSDVAVKCRIARGACAKYGVVEIFDDREPAG